ncbi:MAG: Crp/Fnr family transcriptional regulator [Cypionkella sp.]
MPTDVQDAEYLLQPFFRRLTLRDNLGDEEQAALVDAAGDLLEFAPGQDLVTEGSRPSRSLLVAQGFTCRYRLLSSGERQLTAIHLPGDFVDLHSLLLKEMDHSVGALTHVTIVAFPHERLVGVTERFPHLTRMLWLSTLLDGSLHREWLVGMGRLSAPQRTAHLICELYRRLEALGLAEGHRFSLPITQAALADAVGISSVHINRVLQEMRQQNLIAWSGGVMEILDWDALVAEADFDERYLHLVREPR